MEESKKPKYPNLAAEMARNGENQAYLAKLVGLSQKTMSKKLRGIVPFTLGEVEIICNHYKQNYYELFK